MSTWKRIHDKATGALPVGTLTKWGVVAISLMLSAFILSQSLFNSAPEEEAIMEAGMDLPAGPGTQAQVSARIREEALRQEAQRQAAERALQRRRQLGLSTPEETPVDFPGNTPTTFPSGVVGADTIVPSSEAEAELREVLRLEEIERRRRSLRSAPVAQSFREVAASQAAPATAGISAAPAVATAPPTPAAPGAPITPQSYDPPPVISEALQQSIDMLGDAVADLEATGGQVAAEHEGVATPTQGVAPVMPGETSAAPTVLGLDRDYSNPTTMGAPEDPPGFERIYEGSFLEAVLVTQLSGDFPGPVLASVSVPFYSADRQRILVPRGTRAIGTATQISGLDQERLLVGFHRILFPDGRWVALDFQGLNQLGEGALKDQVNRHYLSMFMTVGAVGIISGLTLQGSNPYAGGVEGIRSGAGQGFGQGAMQILQRFLNRLPNITIRSGHRLRIWFTSDVLVPRPE